MRSRTKDFAARLRAWCTRTGRLMPASIGGLAMLAMMANAQESKDEPATEVDPFSQPPGQSGGSQKRSHGLN
jgi:hypothetical protein